MKDNASENYLDQLLNSVSKENTKESDSMKQEAKNSEDPWERELFGDSGDKDDVIAKNEEDFLREFEEELLKDDMMMPFSDLGQENEKEVDDTIDRMISRMSDPDEVKPDDPEPSVDEDAEFTGTLPDEPSLPEQEDPDRELSEQPPAQDAASDSIDAAVGQFDESLSNIPDELQPPTTGEADLSAAGEDDELDLSGIGDQDLMDMLSDSADLSELGDLLSSAEEERPVEEGDSIGEFAQAQMDAQESEVQQAEEEATGKAKKKKHKKDGSKPGFFARFKKLLFGEDEDTASEEDVAADGAAGMSEENKKILKELEEAGEIGEPKPKKEKKKKEKKKKEAKPPKPKKEKKPKPKKEKKPKEKDNTPPLPKGPVIAICLMVASLFALVMLGTKLLGYQVNVDAAKTQYGKGSFVEAFSELQGLKMQKKDAEFYDQLQVLSTVSQKYQNYLVFANNGKDDIALDSLICAYGRYDLNKQKAEDSNCSVEYAQLGEKIVKALQDDYGMSAEEALQMYQAPNRREYTLQLHAKLKELGLE